MVKHMLSTEIDNLQLVIECRSNMIMYICMYICIILLGHSEQLKTGSSFTGSSFTEYPYSF